MNQNSEQNGLGWIVGESIMIELDMILNIINGYVAPSSFEDMAQVYNRIPEDVIKDFKKILPKDRIFLSPLMKTALILNVIYENDYKKASLAIRKTDITELFGRLKSRIEALNINVKLHTDEASDSVESSIELATKIELISEEKIGLVSFQSHIKKQARINSLFISQILRGGELEYDFWLCMDRFYYEVYLPWRDKQKAEIESQRNKALTNLKADVSKGSIPSLEWLRESHPVIQRSTLTRGLVELNCRLHFITMPFKYFDLFHVEPGYCLFTLSESAWKNKKWLNSLLGLTDYMKAISDPTRLSILRLIRHNQKYTTELASFMNLSRPTVSEHCKILRNAGLIETIQEGRKSYHSLKPETIRNLLKQLENYLDMPDT